MGDKATVFYSRYGEIRDSIRNEGLKKGLSAWELYEETKGYPQSGTTPTFYQLYNEKKTRSAVRYKCRPVYKRIRSRGADDDA